MFLLLPAEGQRPTWWITGRTTSQKLGKMMWLAGNLTGYEGNQLKLMWVDVMSCVMFGLQDNIQDGPSLSSHDYWWWKSYLYIISVLNKVQSGELRYLSVSHIHRDFGLQGCRCPGRRCFLPGWDTETVCLPACPQHKVLYTLNPHMTKPQLSLIQRDGGWRLCQTETFY